MRANARAIVFVLALFLAAIVAIAAFAFLERQNATVARPSSSSSEIEIVGSAKFVNHVEKALALLKNKSPDAYLIVENNVKRIQQGERSGMWAFSTPPTYEMSGKTAFASLTWCAATIAHDSYHSKLYHDYQKSHDGPVPDAVWTGSAAERQCMKHQLAVMEQIEAAKSEIGHALKQADGHFVKDGETWSDYEERDY
jgi:hypothetical protein